MSICSCKHNSIFHEGGFGPCAKCNCPKKEEPVMKTIQDKLRDDDYRTKLPYFTSKGNPEGAKAFREAERYLAECFKRDLFEELGITNNPKAEILYRIAYDLGHSGGYSEVYGYAQDLVELIE
jgi:hypothetical protein